MEGQLGIFLVSISGFRESHSPEWVGLQLVGQPRLMLMANVYLDRVQKRYPDGTVAVNQLTLEIHDRELLVLVGPSGCGKSTLLRLISGLETLTNGTVSIGGSSVAGVSPRDRDLAMVFQNYALYPNMSVYRNLSLGLRLRQIGGFFGDGVIGRGLRKLFQPHRASELSRLQNEIDEKVRQTAKRLGLESLLQRRPHQLSGGERQRVALGRAIVRNPAAFLFDEPLSNLDAQLRQQMRGEIRRLHRELDATVVYVTHDQVEAMALGDRIAVMKDGEIVQIGRPLEIYQRPANLFVAKFFGNLPINVCSGTVKLEQHSIQFNGDLALSWAIDDPEMMDGVSKLKEQLESGPAREVQVGFRPEDVELCQTGSKSPDSGAAVTVVDLEHLGDSVVLHCTPSTQFDNLNSASASVFLIQAKTGLNLMPGDSIHVTVDFRRLLWFDPETGENLVRENYEPQ